MLRLLTNDRPAAPANNFADAIRRAGFDFGYDNQGGKAPTAAAPQDTAMQQARIIGPVTPVRVQRDGDCSVPVTRQEFNALMQQLQPQGPAASGYNSVFGTGGGFSSTSPYKGGQIATERLVVPDDSTPNVFQLDFSALNRARLTSTWMLRVGAIVQPGTVNGGQLAAQSYSATLTTRINGFPVAQFNNVPLGSILPNLIGTPQDFNVPVQIPPDAVVDFELRLLDTLTGTPGQTTIVQLIATFGVPAGALAAQATQLGYSTALAGMNGGCW